MDAELAMWLALGLVAGSFLLIVAAALLSTFAVFMLELPLIISIPLFVIFPPLFFAFLGGLVSLLLINPLADAWDTLRHGKRECERRKWQEHKRALGYDE